MTVVNMVIGAPTDSGARVVTKVSSASNVRLAVADNPGVESPVFFGPVTPDAQNVATVAATGLDPDTRYWWRIEHGGVIDTSLTGRLWTLPKLGEPARFEIVVAGDGGANPAYPGQGSLLASDRMSNHPVFDVIRQRDPRFFVHLGDKHYYDLSSGLHGIVGGASLSNLRRAYDDLLLQPRQHQLYREVPWIEGYDDHDFLGNDKRGNEDATGAANAIQVFGERSPHFNLVSGAGHFQSWEAARILFAYVDVRTNADANSAPAGPTKTMLGATQKAALEAALSSSDAKFLVFITPSQWTATTHPDSWASFTNERAELVTMFGDTGWLDRMVCVYADRHAAGIDSGSHPDGGFPLMMAASLDASPGELKDPPDFDLGSSLPGRNQYGMIALDDWGPVIRCKLTTWNGATQLLIHSFAVDTGEPAFSAAITRAVSGSHRATFEARVVEDFQVGSDPTGTEIPILSGDVQLDGTAEIRGTLSLDTDGNGTFPRGGESLLAPFGNEIFVHRGVDLGDRVEWAPLGYYRINAPEQDDAPDGPISISGSDRMAGIIDGRLTAPRQFTADRLIGHIFYELVTDIYPDAAILFDDALSKTALGRDLVAEESRYEALADIATAHGKIMYWDGFGVLRVEDAPEPAEIAWEVRSGTGGVLVQTGRRLTREGVFNGVVATGEAADTEDPVRALVVDRNPNSATFWGGRFGKVPRFYSSPAITTQTQAQSAATKMLRRSIGFPYSVDLTAVPHPGIKPWDPVRVTQSNGDREIHVIQAVTIPLTADAALSANTQEQTLVLLGGA